MQLCDKESIRTVYDVSPTEERLPRNGDSFLPCPRTPLTLPVDLSAAHLAPSTTPQGSLFYIVAHTERQRNAQRQKARAQMSFLGRLVDRLPNPRRGWTTENRAGQFEWTEEKFHL